MKLRWLTIALLAGSAFAHTVALSWYASTSSGVTAYRVYRATKSGGPYTLYAPLGIVTAYTDTVTPDCSTFYYVVTAVAGTTESANSNEAQAKMPCVAPNGPNNLRKTSQQ